MKLLLFKCGYGHYFRNVSCPYDGWTHGDIRRAESVFSDGDVSSIDDLRGHGIDESLLRRCLIMDSEEYGTSLEGIAFASIVIDGKVVQKEVVQ